MNMTVPIVHALSSINKVHVLLSKIARTEKGRRSEVENESQFVAFNKNLQAHRERDGDEKEERESDLFWKLSARFKGLFGVCMYTHTWRVLNAYEAILYPPSSSLPHLHLKWRVALSQAQCEMVSVRNRK